MAGLIDMSDAVQRLCADTVARVSVPYGFCLSPDTLADREVLDDVR